MGDDMAWELLGNGMDKEFWAEDTENGGFGVICCSTQVASREMQAYIRLKTEGLGDLLPVILPWDRRKTISLPGAARVETKPAEIAEGKTPQYEIQRIKLGKTFKPLMCVFGVSAVAKAELKRGDPDKVRRGLEQVTANLDAICGIVGELTLAVDGRSKQLFMLDFAPGEGKSTAIQQKDKIAKGLENLLAAL